ncbi:hypothetical protein [Acidovorax sp. ACV01]|uniref:hypothetical protein n=1 Tax=Acidovorax sp. ACV01 TaxID=2769311 RepID=UPI001785215F|nr:hypothetical protein [Acidovorax sp. ACV01]MBD9395161.1 hypothetical protein [Acidovorax sp. ACV01]
MEWLFILIIAGCAAFMLAGPKRKPTARNTRTIAPANIKPPEPGTPITTQKAACDYLDALLASRSAGVRRTMVADMREQMREHVEELRTNIEYLTEEIAKQLEFRQGVAEDLEGEADENAEPDDEDTARTRRHLAHLDREMAEMKQQLAADKQALRDFRTDRTTWVQAYAKHCLHTAQNPNLGRSRHGI